MVEGAPDVVRSGNAIEHFEEPGLETLRSEGGAVAGRPGEQRGQVLRDRLGIRLYRPLLGARQRVEQPLQRDRLGERRSSAAEKDRLQPGRESILFEFELSEQRFDVRPV